MKILHITHNDLDAVGCDVLVRLYCQGKFGIDAGSDEIKTCWCNPTSASETVIRELDMLRCNGQPLPSAIYISDISVTYECARQLEDLSFTHGFELKLFDHHQTNQLANHFRWCEVVVSDPPVSATMIMFNEFSKYINTGKYNGIRTFCEKISRYDTWLWKKDPVDYSEEDYSILSKFYGVENYSLQIVKNSFNCEFSEFDKMVISRFKEQRDEDVAEYVDESKIAFVRDGDLTIAYTMYNGSYSNAVLEAIYNKYKEVDIVAGLIPVRRQISFRSNKPNINVGAYAKEKYGGGGHPSAAGAIWLAVDLYLEILRSFYENVGKGIR